MRPADADWLWRVAGLDVGRAVRDCCECVEVMQLVRCFVAVRVAVAGAGGTNGMTTRCARIRPGIERLGLRILEAV